VVLPTSGVKMKRMRKRWQETWQNLQAPTVPLGVLEELINAYSSPERFYHNLSHIADCHWIFDRAKSLTTYPEEVELAIWFHDAIYDTRSSNNEQRSAEWAKSVIHQTGLSHDLADRVSQLILATGHHGEVRDSDAQVLVDVDLSILGREKEVFWQYEENIRQEYAWVPADRFRQKRTEVLRGFLNRSYIYHLEVYREAFEETARLNLTQAIAQL
jgi:predicted metal-dependent HD superfamily phosphohydrolase